MKNIIHLQQIGELDKSILIKLRKDLKWSFKEFNFSVEILDDVLPLNETEYNKNRRQYNADLVMEKLLHYNLEKKYFRILGIMDNDIYVRRYNFIFGTASNPDRINFRFSPVALISVTRLREQFWNRTDNISLFELRVLKEAIHELGHTFGLFHCDNDCIMVFSNWIGDTDNKPPTFCDSCSRKLKYILKSIV
ncbi:MAG: archaemetzincin family Zn-dependent metalloprotease [Candidatus Thorarchaeota archaeon]